MDAKTERQFTDHIRVFDNPSVQAAIKWLQDHGYTLGNIVAAILANLPQILAAIKSGDPVAIITILLGVLGKAPAPPVPSARIGT